MEEEFRAESPIKSIFPYTNQPDVAFVAFRIK